MIDRKEFAAEAAPVQTRFAFQAHVLVDGPVVIGPSAHGFRRIVPVTGGEVTGPRLQGRVIPGGADWQFVRPDGVLQIEAKYTLQAADGVSIMVTNRGLRHGSPEIIDKLSRGEAVDPALYYFRTCAEFEAPLDSAHAWLNRALFVGVARRTATAAIVRFHELL
ncbi:DUF3237 domain-containing protein [Peristeroidobacter soli]|jgi:hypothetical protein|uniref:DUF3237 domain-containing protein n=1 Tax=Peristeroidobacter soli TaxID=2497877 RepID=UPI00101C83C5|nr:DUF3237 domain-containing protein [Peristeroidobacter soli]